MSIRTCSSCLHWIDGICRAGPPTASPDGAPRWPKTAATDWCYRFKAQIQAVGIDRKFSDEQVIEYVSALDKEGVTNEGVELPRQAIKRSDLVAMIRHDFNVTHTPALRRIEKLVRQGVFKQGANPWPTETSEPGIYIWMGDAKPEDQPKPVVNRSSQLLSILQSVAPDERHALSVRAFTKVVEPALHLSSTSVHRKLQRLIEEGLVVKSDFGYYAAPQKGVGS